MTWIKTIPKSQPSGRLAAWFNYINRVANSLGVGRD